MSLLHSRLRLMPGTTTPIDGVREPLAERLLRGRAAVLAPALLGRLYSLCGQAHRICAELALQALHTPDAAVQADAGQRLALWRETVREHVRRICLDWPRLLGGAARDVSALSASPAWGQSVEPGDSVLQDWVMQQVLGMHAARWCAACQDAPSRWLHQWVDEMENAVTHMLRQAKPRGWPLPAMRLDAQPATWMALAQQLRADADFARAPHMDGQWRETGCWSRALDSWLPVQDVWTRLAARVNDLAHLVQADGLQRLQAGSLALGPGEALAWCEMARGLLVHWLRVDAQGRIERYGVLAPTEWNFHPRGAAAQVLCRLPAQMPQPDVAAQVGMLVASFDPCVDYELVLLPQAQESAYA